MWDCIEQIRNDISGYESEIVSPVQNKAREASRIAMRKLYARRRAAGLNAHGKPFSVKQRTNKKYNNEYTKRNSKCDSHKLQDKRLSS